VASNGYRAPNRPLETGERQVRPLIDIKWDGKLVLAAYYTTGYFVLAYFIIRYVGSPLQKELALIVLAALGPQLGQIFAAIYRTTGADERQAALRSSDLQKAIETPSTVVAAPEQTNEDPEILK
jgi:hypothetical protein